MGKKIFFFYFFLSFFCCWYTLSNCFTRIPRGRKKQPRAVCTALGWALLRVADGSVSKGRIPLSFNHNKANHQKNLERTFEKFWTIKSFCTKFENVSPKAVYDHEVLKGLNQVSSLVSGHYVVLMLWKKPRTSKRETRHVASKRLEHLTCRFRRNPELCSLYSQGVQNYIQQGYARNLVSPTSPSHKHKQTWEGTYCFWCCGKSWEDFPWTIC